MTRDAFLAASSEHIASLVPPTVIVSVNGTRRSAALDGIQPHTDEYVAWSRQQMLAYMDLLFAHGFQHVFSALIIAPNMVEFASYRERFLAWMDQGIAGPQALHDYAARGWRVRLTGVENVPELHAAAARLVAATPTEYKHTLWWTVTPTADAPWNLVLETAARTRARTRPDLIRAIYGEDVPLANLFISFGKPIAIYDLLPPLLIDHLQCYWVQRPGYRIDQPLLRAILYDYLYSRQTGSGPTWSARYADLAGQQDLWTRDAVLGLGTRLGPFWYPAPFPAEDMS
jgi:hypothetical protein